MKQEADHYLRLGGEEALEKACSLYETYLEQVGKADCWEFPAVAAAATRFGLACVGRGYLKRAIELFTVLLRKDSHSQRYEDICFYLAYINFYQRQYPKAQRHALLSLEALGSGYDDYSEDSEPNEVDGDEDDMRLTIMEKENILLTQALERIRRAQALGKTKVKLTAAERDALEKKMAKNKAKGKKLVVASKKLGGSPRSSRKPSKASLKHNADAELKSCHQSYHGSRCIALLVDILKALGASAQAAQYLEQIPCNRASYHPIDYSTIPFSSLLSEQYSIKLCIICELGRDNPSVYDSNGRTMLHYAAWYGWPQTVCFLIESSTDMIDAVAADGQTALALAVFRGETQIVELLCCKKGSLELSGPAGYTPLILAAMQGHTKIVKMLIEAGADIDGVSRLGATALMHAAGRGHVDCVVALLENRANINITDRLHGSALTTAIWYRQYKVANILLYSGADINLCGGGTRPLVAAAFRGNLQFVKDLLDNGANPHLYDCEGLTALMAAALKNNEPVIKELLQHGAVDDYVYLQGNRPGATRACIENECLSDALDIDYLSPPNGKSQQTPQELDDQLHQDQSGEYISSNAWAFLKHVEMRLKNEPTLSNLFSALPRSLQGQNISVSMVMRFVNAMCLHHPILIEHFNKFLPLEHQITRDHAIDSNPSARTGFLAEHLSHLGHKSSNKSQQAQGGKDEELESLIKQARSQKDRSSASGATAQCLLDAMKYYIRASREFATSEFKDMDQLAFKDIENAIEIPVVALQGSSMPIIWTSTFTDGTTKTITAIPENKVVSGRVNSVDFPHGI